MLSEEKVQFLRNEQPKMRDLLCCVVQHRRSYRECTTSPIILRLDQYDDRVVLRLHFELADRQTCRVYVTMHRHHVAMGIELGGNRYPDPLLRV